MKKIHLVPLVGLVAAVVEHWKVCEVHNKNPTLENFEKTWDAFGSFHTALISYAVGVALIVLGVIAWHLK